ncbi:MAG: hypothetical protein WEB60_12335, partial [Terrimicrobiaceae bacterium]
FFLAFSSFANSKNDKKKGLTRSAVCLETSKQFVRRNPVTDMLGAVAFGLAIGCIILRARKTSTFGERFANDPLESLREAVTTTLAPATQRLHDGYDSARGGVGKILDRVHHIKEHSVAVSHHAVSGNPTTLAEEEAVAEQIGAAPTAEKKT